MQQFKCMVDKLYFKYILLYILNLFWQTLFIYKTTRRKRDYTFVFHDASGHSIIKKIKLFDWILFGFLD